MKFEFKQCSDSLKVKVNIEILKAKIEHLQIQKIIMATLNLKNLLKLGNGRNGLPLMISK